MAKKKEQSWVGELGDDILKLIAKHWWKVVILVAATGIAITGFTCEWGKVKIHKDPVKLFKDELPGVKK